MSDSQLSVAELVRRLRHNGRRMPFEIGAFICLEACSQVLEAPALLGPARVFIEKGGDVRVDPGERVDSAVAAGAIVGILAHNLIAAGTSVPPSLMDLVEGKSPAVGDLHQLHDELEASLVPLNRGASRRVLARLLRDAPHPVPGHSQPPAPVSGEVDEALDSLLDVPTGTGAMGLAGTHPAPASTPGAQKLPSLDSSANDGATTRQMGGPEAAPSGETRTEVEPVSDVGSAELEHGPSTASMDQVNDAQTAEREPAKPKKRAPARFNQTLPLGAPLPIEGIKKADAVKKAQAAKDAARKARASTPDDSGRPSDDAGPVEPANSELQTVLHQGRIVPEVKEALPAGFEGGKRRRGRIPDLGNLDDQFPSAPRGVQPIWIAAGVAALLAAGALVYAIGGDDETEASTEETTTAPARPERPRGTLEVRTGAADGEVFLFVGRSPATAEGLPLGVAFEFLAVGEGKRPTRAVVPAGAEFSADETPLYELAMQTSDEEMDFNELRLPPSRLEAGAMGSPAGGVGDVRVVTAPPGARVFLLVGIGESVVVNDLTSDEPHELLVWSPSGQESRRRFVGPSDWREEGGQRSALVE